MVADCLNHDLGKDQAEKEKQVENIKSTSQQDAKSALTGQEVANQNEAGNKDKEGEEKQDDSNHKKKPLGKVQSVQVYENGCLCTKFVELDDEESNDKLNGTIEYSRDYRLAEGPSCSNDSNVTESADVESASSRTSSEQSLHNSSGSLKDLDNSFCSQTGPNLENIEENSTLGNFTINFTDATLEEGKNTFNTVTDATSQENFATGEETIVCNYEIYTEQDDNTTAALNLAESVSEQFSFQVNVDNMDDSVERDFLNLEENMSYYVDFDLLESNGRQTTDQSVVENLTDIPDAMDAKSSGSNKRILYGQQQLQGSKFRDPSTSDLENESPRGDCSNSSQSTSVPSDHAICIEQASFCCVDYKKLRKSTKPSDITEKQSIPVQDKEIPSSSTQDDFEMSGPSPPHSTSHEKRKGSKKPHKSKKTVSEDSSELHFSDESQNIALNAKSEKQTPAQSEDKYLIFTKGSETYTPHQIGIKRIKPLKAFNDRGQLLPNVEDNTQGLDRGEDYYDEVDHLIDMDGHIIGMCLSPDQR